MAEEVKIHVYTNTYIILSAIIGILMFVIGLIIMYLMNVFLGRISLYVAFGIGGALVFGFFSSTLTKSVRIRTFCISDNNLCVSDDQQDTIIPDFDIKNYNVYNLIPKNIGYIIRIRGNKNYCYWAICNNENKESFQKNRNKLITMLTKLNRPRKVELIDRMIICTSWIPIIIASLAILTVIGIFVWIYTCR